MAIQNGTEGDDLIENGPGSDTINGLGGNDTIDGGAGRDTIDGGVGDDLIRGGADDDTVLWSPGRDTMFGGTGTDTLDLSTRSQPPITVGFGIDTGPGGMVIVGGGTDTSYFNEFERMIMTRGDDRFEMAFINSISVRAFEMGSGNDYVRTSTGAVAGWRFDGGPGTDRFDFANQPATIFDMASGAFENRGATASVLGFEIALASSQADNIMGTAGADSIYGRQGDDTLTGRGGDDLLDGGTGNDLQFGGDGNDTLYGGGGANPENDTLWGGVGDDVFHVANGLNEADGGPGDDTFWFGYSRVPTGDSTLLGGEGSDVFRVSADFGRATILGGDGADTDSLRLERSGLNWTIAIDAEPGMLRATTTGSLVRFGGIEVVSGSRGIDVLDLSAATTGHRFDITTGEIDLAEFGITSVTLFEGMIGGAGDDTILGSDGEDILGGGGGQNILRGGAGDDLYRFDIDAPGETRISETGGRGTDRLDIADVQAADLGFARSGLHLVIETAGRPGRVVIEDHFSDVRTDRIEMLTTSDGLWFLKQDPVGTATADILVGASGSDTLRAGAGDDIVAGGGAKDFLRGEEGADVFVYTALSDSTAAAPGRDTLYGFSRAGGDRVSLRQIDADTGTAGHQDFTFAGEGFPAGAGTLSYVWMGGNTLVLADVDGNGADFSVLLEGMISLTAGDFIL